MLFADGGDGSAAGGGILGAIITGVPLAWVAWKKWKDEAAARSSAAAATAAAAALEAERWKDDREQKHRDDLIRELKADAALSRKREAENYAKIRREREEDQLQIARAMEREVKCEIEKATILERLAAAERRIAELTGEHSPSGGKVP